MNQNYLLQGGVYRAIDGKHWSQFNDNSPLAMPFAPGITNALSPGNCITTLSNLVFIATGNNILVFDSTPPPITNRPPIALPQVVNLWQNTSSNIALTGRDADGDSLTFAIATGPAHGALSGTAPNLVYTPANNFLGLDFFTFTATDGSLTSAPAIFNLAVNPATNPPPAISFTSPADGSWFVTPATISLAVSATDNDGFVRVNFYDGTNLLGFITNTPYTLTLTNPAPGEHTFFARATDRFSARTWAAPATVIVLPTSPVLQIQQPDSSIISLSWPLDLDGFYLESAPDISGPWTLSPDPPFFYPGGQSVTPPATSADRLFYRLMLPH
jgi:hypothetical protein